MSHGDRMRKPRARVEGDRPQRQLADCRLQRRRESAICGIQFHPEVHHSERGTDDAPELRLRPLQSRAQLDDGELRRPGGRAIRAQVGDEKRDLRALGRRRLRRRRGDHRPRRSATSSRASSSTTACLRQGEAERVVERLPRPVRRSLPRRRRADAVPRRARRRRGSRGEAQDHRARRSSRSSRTRRRRSRRRASSRRARSIPTSSSRSRSRARPRRSRATTTSAACPSA